MVRRLAKEVITYEEREKLKYIASRGFCLAECLTMIAHFARQTERIEFSLYASNWIEAEKRKDLSALKEFFPFSGKRRIADNCSDWDSFSGGF